MRAAVLQRLPDRGRAERLARVDRDVEVLAAAVLERVEVRLGRVARLLAGDVEADDATLAVRDGELGHLERVGPVAHRGDDLAQRDRVVSLRALEPARDGLDDLLEVEPPLEVEDRRVTDLRVDDAVGRQVRAALVRDALETLGCLHDRDRVFEAAKVERQRARGRARVEPTAELERIDRGEPAVADLLRELDHGPRSQPSVEMVVKEDLGRGAEDLERDHRSYAARAALIGTGAGSRRRRVMKMSAWLTQSSGTAYVGMNQAAPSWYRVASTAMPWAIAFTRSIVPSRLKSQTSAIANGQPRRSAASARKARPAATRSP